MRMSVLACMKLIKERASAVHIFIVFVDTMRDEVKNIVTVEHRPQAICSLGSGSAKERMHKR